MNKYSSNFYQEILTCYEYETKNTSVYGNVILCEMESSQGGKQCGSNLQGDENMFF